MDTMPHETRYIILLYHQCVIIATRPLLLSVLKEMMEKLGRPEEEWHRFMVLPRNLVSIGIKSAAKSLEILSDENIILETFLPFDLEFTFSAAIHLAIAHTLFQFDTTDYHHTTAAYQVLDQLISSENRVAEVWRTELNHLQSLFQEFSYRIDQQGRQILTLSRPTDEEPRPEVNTNEENSRLTNTESTTLEWPGSSNGEGDAFVLAQDPLAQNLNCLEAIGTSSNEFLSIVDQIGIQDPTYGIWDPTPEWLAGSDTPKHTDYDT